MKTETHKFLSYLATQLEKGEAFDQQIKPDREEPMGVNHCGIASSDARVSIPNVVALSAELQDRACHVHHAIDRLTERLSPVTRNHPKEVDNRKSEVQVLVPCALGELLQNIMLTVINAEERLNELNSSIQLP